MRWKCHETMHCLIVTKLPWFFMKFFPPKSKSDERKNMVQLTITTGIALTNGCSQKSFRLQPITSVSDELFRQKGEEPGIMADRWLRRSASLSPKVWAFTILNSEAKLWSFTRVAALPRDTPLKVWSSFLLKSLEMTTGMTFDRNHCNRQFDQKKNRRG